MTASRIAHPRLSSPSMSEISTPVADPPARGKGRLFWPALLGVLAVDIASKQWAVTHLEPQHVPHPIIGDVVRFTLGYNPGMAFSLHVGSASRWFFTVVAILVLVMLGRFYRETPASDRARILALGLVCGGAVGNLLDRIDIGVGTTRFWTFNVADAGVSVGAILLAWTLLRDERRAKAHAHADAEAEAKAEG